MRQYHTEDRGDHWKFRSGSLPGVNERQQEVCVVSTGNNNHRREGEAQRCTSCCSLNVSMTANVPQARHIFLLQCETSLCSWTCLGSFEQVSPPLQKASSVLNVVGAERKAEAPKVKLGQQPCQRLSGDHPDYQHVNDSLRSPVAHRDLSLDLLDLDEWEPTQSFFCHQNTPGASLKQT